MTTGRKSSRISQEDKKYLNDEIKLLEKGVRPGKPDKIKELRRLRRLRHDL